MAGIREVIPEILDSLPQNDPRAVRSRRDLHRVNVVMGNYQWIAGKIQTEVESGLNEWMELGAGDGPLGRALPGSLIDGIKAGAVDFLPRPESWPARWEWTQGDLFEFLDSRPAERNESGMISNMFLHHFSDTDLGKIGSTLQSSFSRLLICEPARFRRFEWLGRPFFPILNDVTRHDMIVSIRAGFRKGELPNLLGLDSNGWKWTETVSLMGAFRLDAQRRE